ncbi:MAG: aldehyde dehydrogenase [Candidatus Handelsmanbacteria bacterium RIFCSPLOWO2_12_FULL_64_10]|uniref:Aldehyde dehydrogenase n=1 Tax=Handelsmanbacteria sp. (strain RIFCSPLOWO2_12_FULL_64_10) TaxID=1817868 RepID=A0A1F6CPA1_HANXR|nr:MAG: aldehyde dehydrogenase [Candidatus Handelsmanbacteria bacterium RIFCSPLOWO2_12_FULL_64_10]
MVDAVRRIPNWIDGVVANPGEDGWLDKFDPHSGKLLARVADSSADDAAAAVAAAAAAFEGWSALTPVRRGQILGDVVAVMKRRADELAECLAIETGKPPQDAKGETGGAILQGEYFAGEGMRLYARSLTSGTPGKYSHTVRQPRGVAALIVPANTPIANIAWKTFPALICGNTVAMKAAEDAPRIALLFAQLAKEAGLPDGVLNVVQGRGDPAGAALVKDPRVAVISFTGSTGVGRWIAEVAGRRLARVSLELGGKNPFVVCDDADLDQAVLWAALSAFSNAGQRCAAGSRIIVFKGVYEAFRDKLVAKVKSLKLGVAAGCDLGPVVNRRQLEMILSAIDHARRENGKVLCGGGAPSDSTLALGYYIEPTLIEGLAVSAELSCKEVFGPVATLHVVGDLPQALALANATEYGLTAAIHTRSVDRAMWFAQRVRAGVANVNLGTFGSEPHMPFGGFGASGNGSSEPGVEALDVYSELKNISFLTRADLI